MIKKEAEKILKYKDLTIEIERMWNVKTKVIPVIIGAAGTVSKSYRKHVGNIPGKHEVKELQKTTIAYDEIPINRGKQLLEDHYTKIWNATYVNTANASHTKLNIPTIFYRLSLPL